MALRQILLPWDSQPQEAVGVNWANPVANGLVAAYMPGLSRNDFTGIGGALDVVTGGNIVSRPAVTPLGIANYIPSSTSTYTETTCATALAQRAAEATVMWFGTRIGTPSASDAPILFGTRTPYSTANTAPYACAAVYVSSAGSLTFAWNDSNSYRSIASGSIAVGETASVALTVKSGAAKAFKNGAQVGSTSSLASSIAYGASSGIGFDSHAYDTYSNCAHVLGLYWSRALSDAEVAAIAANPWQLFAAQRIMVPVASGAPGGIAGTLSATESGEDTAAVSGAVVVSGAASAAESGSDAASATGSVLVQGLLSAVESGADSASLAGQIIVTGLLSATESGSDTASISGGAMGAVTGSIAATEVGSDTATAVGGVLVSGDVSATETGSDTAQIYETAPTVEPLRFDIATGRLVKIISGSIAISF